MDVMPLVDTRIDLPYPGNTQSFRRVYLCRHCVGYAADVCGFVAGDEHDALTEEVARLTAYVSELEEQLEEARDSRPMVVPAEDVIRLVESNRPAKRALRSKAPAGEAA